MRRFRKSTVLLTCLFHTSSVRIHEIIHDYVYSITTPVALLSMRLSETVYTVPRGHCPLSYVTDKSPPGQYFCGSYYKTRTKSWIRLIKFMLENGLYNRRCNQGVRNVTHPNVACLILKYNPGNSYSTGVTGSSLLFAAISTISTRISVIPVLNTLGCVSRGELEVESRRSFGRVHPDILRLLHVYSFQRLLRHRFSVSY